MKLFVSFMVAVTDRFTDVSTAGGASLEWVEGKTLPGVEVLKVAQLAAATRR
jgi:3-phosphoglycerate kinase